MTVIGVVILGAGLAYGLMRSGGRFRGYGRPIDSQPEGEGRDPPP